MTEQVSYTKIKSHRNGARLWIEGVKLDSAGFKRGGFYDRKVEGDTIILTANPNGQYKVSGRNRNGKDLPIIDIALGKSETFKDGTRLRAIFKQGSITVSVHHEEDAKQRREERLKKAIINGELTHASACTGGAISTSAIHEAITENGIQAKTAWVVDCELKYLQSAYAHSFAINDDTVCFEAKLEELETNLLSEVDVLSFSLPCAGLSRSGTSKHKLTPEQHESGTSVFGIRDMIRAANPAIISSENVPEAQDSPMYVLLIQELTRLGYTIVERVLDNSQTNTFENRRRYWFIAVSNGLVDIDINLVFNFLMERHYQTVNDLLDDVVDESVWADNQYLKDKAVRDRAKGKGFANRQLLWGHETRIGTIGRFYHKRRSTEPFITRKDGKERLLSILEHARAKSIPESLVENCNMTHGHEILGQSIDYRQAFAPMYHLVEWLKHKFNVKSLEVA